MLNFLLFFLVKISYSDEVVTTLPRCTSTREVRALGSAIIRRIIQPGQSLCIRGYPDLSRRYLGNLYFVFNKLSGVTPQLYYRDEYNEWRLHETTVTNPGGAGSGQQEAMLYLEAPENEAKEVNIGFSTLDPTCQTAILSGDPDDDVNMIREEYIGRLNCYFNGVNGGQHLTVYSNNTRCGCMGAVYPKSPTMISTYTSLLDFNNDQGSAQFVMFTCERKTRRSYNHITVESQTDMDDFIDQTVSIVTPGFYPRTKPNSDLALILGLAIGIPVGCVGIALGITFYVTDCFDRCECCIECCHDCTIYCSCKMDFVPTKYRENIIKEYSYSDDRTEMDNIPEYNDAIQ